MSDAPHYCTRGELCDAIIEAIQDFAADGGAAPLAKMADLGGLLLEMQKRYAALRFVDNPHPPVDQV